MLGAGRHGAGLSTGVGTVRLLSSSDCGPTALAANLGKNQEVSSQGWARCELQGLPYLTCPGPLWLFVALITWAGLSVDAPQPLPHTLAQCLAQETSWMFSSGSMSTGLRLSGL